VPAGNLSSSDVQSALNELDAEKAPVNGAVLQDPTCNAPAANDNSSKIINSAWFSDHASSANPIVDGVATPGVSFQFARADHVHPVDASRAPVNSPAFGGVPTGPTAPVDTNTNQLATCAFVLAQPVNAIANGIVTFIKMASSAIATTAQFRAAAADKLLTADRVWAAAAPVSLIDGTTVTPDLNQGIDFVLTLGSAASRTLANPTNLKLGQKGTIYLIQDATGDRTITTWGGNYKFPNGIKPTLSTAGNAIDAISYQVFTSSAIMCSFVKALG
jgi:hypothetical protein